MGRNILSGAKTFGGAAARGTIATSGVLTPNSWYEIATVGVAPAIPIAKVSAVFRTPDTTGTPITLAAGDSVYPLAITQVCKTEANVEFEVGTIDVTDDCEEGFSAAILDDIKGISGTLNGFASFNDATGALETNTTSIFNRFINKVTDNGLGVYVETEASNEKFLLFICLNKNAAATQIQNWLIVPVYLTTLSGGAGLRDAQKRDLAWVKAPGYPSLYQRTVFTGDVI